MPVNAAETHDDGEIQPGARWRRRSTLPAVVLTGALTVFGVGAALATPPAGTIARTELAKGRTAGNISIQASNPSDFHIHNVTLDPGASSGWHTHPGPEFSIVKAGTVTFMSAPECTPRTYTAGQALFVPGGTNHFAQASAEGPAELYVTYVVPADTAVRDDAAEPEGCAKK